MMRVKLGDRVRFLNENLQGVVTRIEGNTAGVTIEDDFEIPVLLAEIVPIDDVIIKDQLPKTSPSKQQIIKSNGIYLAFDRVSDSGFDFYIHNSETDFIHVAIYNYSDKKYYLKWKLEVAFEQSAKISGLQIEDFNSWQYLFFHITYLPQSHEGAIRQNMQRDFKISRKDFFAAYKNCFFLQKQAICFRLDEPPALADISKLKVHEFKVEQTNKLTLTDSDLLSADEIDLHAERLIPDYKNLSASEIMLLQLQAAEKALEKAYMAKRKKFIFIHGVGNMFLKSKLRSAFTKYKNWIKEYKDADHLKYGGGATEVWFN